MLFAFFFGFFSFKMTGCRHARIRSSLLQTIFFSIFLSTADCQSKISIWNPIPCKIPKKTKRIHFYVYLLHKWNYVLCILHFFSLYYFRFVEIALLKTVGKALRKVFLERQVEGFFQRNISAQGKYCTCLGNLKVSQFKISSHQ